MRARRSGRSSAAWAALAWRCGLAAVTSLGLPSPSASQCTTHFVSQDSARVEGNQGSSSPIWTMAMTADNRYVVFNSGASNLVPGDTNMSNDGFVRDLSSGTTIRATMTWQATEIAGGGTATCITPDGRYVLFGSQSPGVAQGELGLEYDVFLHDLSTGAVELVSVNTAGVHGNDHSFAREMTPDARFVTFWSYATNLTPGDNNHALDAFVRDRSLGTTTRVSESSTGVQGNGDSEWPVISADGRYVAFESFASNLVPGDTNGWYDVFVRDRTSGTTSLASPSWSGGAANGPSFNPSISADGRFVAYEAFAEDLVADDTNLRSDVFVRDLIGRVTERVSVSSSGIQGDADSKHATISADGRFVGFTSFAGNFVANDIRGWDSFVRDRLLGETTMWSLGSTGVQGNLSSQRCAISPDGRAVVFESFATNLGGGGSAGNTWVDVSVRHCPPSGPSSYCPSKINSQGCSPALTSTGVPSASSGLPFSLDAAELLNAKSGTFVYGVTGPTLMPFQGGLLCVAPPLKRTGLQTSRGSPPPTIDCSGAVQLDFNAWIASGQDPALTAGASVWTQYWSRDPGFAAPGNASLTNALTFTIE